MLETHHVAVAFLSLGIVVSGWLLTRLRNYWDNRTKLSAIPTYGNDGFFSSYVSGWEFVKYGTKVVQDGYKKFPNQAFKIPMLDRYLVVVTGRDMIDDIIKAGDDKLSLRRASNEMFYDHIMFSRTLSEMPYHAHLIEGALTRHLASMFGEVYDELARAFDDEIPATDDWVKVPTLGKALNIVCRTSNRLFIGSPLCRNEEWMELNIRLTIDFFTAATKANLFPRFMQGLVAWYLNPIKPWLKLALKHLEPIIHERVEKLKAGEEDSLPDDFLTWMIQVAPKDSDRLLEPEDLTPRLLGVNIAAIHTTGRGLTHALIDLASHPEYIEPLRKEIEFNIERDGWSKAAMGKMRMLDSFLKESHRFSGSHATAIKRVALEEFVFTNGTVIPAGTLLATSPSALHFDETFYSNPFEFDGFRSYRERQLEGENLKHQMVTPGPNYVTFGAGKQACPGRFFAVNELKALMSHTLLNYDIKLDDADAPPAAQEVSGRVLSDSTTKVMFRKRQVK
ncbi:hypothetical protein V5O48_007605 [Marasmius crinis-equi]|uniref:Cytochrome P450 n=1 Tax=Marasmius crinis-equi TaxID=585013 RepID=A0ABR3FG83_9AGAR